MAHLEDRAELLLGVIDSTTDGLPDLGEDSLDSGAGLNVSDYAQRLSSASCSCTSRRITGYSLLTS